jgi:phosphopantetheinyl transferase
MAELLRENIDNEAICAVWRITESPGELLAMIRLSDREKALYEGFLVEERRKQWLAYRILIRTLLEPDEVPVEYDALGKPYLAGSDRHISVTHSGDLAAVIMSRKGAVGIDIERVRPKIERVKERFLSAEELEAAGNPPDAGLLTLAWCAKEALYKLYGLRNLDFRGQMKVHLPERLKECEFKGEVTANGATSVYRLQSRLLGPYVLVYAAEPGK